MADATALNLAVNLRWLKDVRPDLGSQQALGNKAKIDQRTVGRILNAEHSPTLEKIVALANACGVTAADLLTYRLGAGLYRFDRNHPVPAVSAEPPTEEFVKAALKAIARAEQDRAERAASGAPTFKPTANSRAA